MNQLLLPPRPYLKSSDTVSTVIDVFNSSLRRKIGRKLMPVKWTVSTITDGELIDNIIDKAGLERFRGKTILEMNPGPGFFSERLLEKVKPKKYVAIDSRPQFVEILPQLQAVADPETEIVVRRRDGYSWDAFSSLEEEGILKYEELWHRSEEYNPNLVFVAWMKDKQADQLVAQWIDQIATRSWLQKYGRVQMYCFIPQSARQRLLAPPGSGFRSKGTFIREVTCDVKEILYTPMPEASYLSPRGGFANDMANFPLDRTALSGKASQFHPANALSLLEISPYEHVKVKATWESFEFVVRSLLVARTIPLYQQIRALAGGAYAILADLDPALRMKLPRDMSAEEMDQIAMAFDAWPFKPDVLQEDGKAAVVVKDRAYTKLIRETVRAFHTKDEDHIRNFKLPETAARD